MPCIEHHQKGDDQGYGCAKWEGRTTDNFAHIHANREARILALLFMAEIFKDLC